MGKQIVITEQLAAALMNLINNGTFPYAVRDIKQVEGELYKAIEAANIDVTYTNDPADAESAVASFTGEPV